MAKEKVVIRWDTKCAWNGREQPVLRKNIEPPFPARLAEGEKVRVKFSCRWYNALVVTAWKKEQKGAVKRVESSKTKDMDDETCPPTGGRKRETDDAVKLPVHKRKKDKELYNQYLEEKSQRESSWRLMRLGAKSKRGVDGKKEEVQARVNEDSEGELQTKSERKEEVERETLEKEGEEGRLESVKRKDRENSEVEEERRREKMARKEREKREREELKRKEIEKREREEERKRALRGELERREREKREREEERKREELERREREKREREELERKEREKREREEERKRASRGELERRERERREREEERKDRGFQRMDSLQDDDDILALPLDMADWDWLPNSPSIEAADNLQRGHLLTTDSGQSQVFETLKRIEATLTSFMTETRVAMQNFNDRIEQFENANAVQSLSTPPYGGAVCTTLTKTPSTSELPSLKVLTPSTRSKVSHVLDINPERHKAALKILSMHFTREELANSNCSGVYDKKQLDPKRLAVVKQIVLEKFPPNPNTGENADSVWRGICKKIDTKCRGQKFAEKRGIMLVYDITNDKSFENIKNWIRNIEEHASSDVEKMVLGNKCDMEDKRLVSKERGTQLATEYGIKFMETSAKASINVEEAFFTLARDIKLKMDKKIEQSSPQASSTIHVTQQPKPSKGFFRCTIL